jgi:hypothetical protein
MKVIVAFFISMFSVLGIYTDKYDQAQAAYRNGDFVQAEAILRPLVRENRDDASILMAYTYLQLGKLEQSEALFKDKYTKKIGGSDIAFGLALVARARQDFAEAKKYGLEAASKDRADVKEFLEKLPKPQTVIPRSFFARPSKTDAPFTASNGFLRDRKGNPIIVRGINLGVALPGKYPSEFPLEQGTYRDWLDLIAQMNANVVRLYTILPPTFYTALRDYNLKHPNKPLYVIHGVWTELPEEIGLKQYRGAFTDQFLTEAKRVVHVVHGRLDLPAKPGHANGSFTADISPWVLAYVVGREWEPSSVATFNRKADAPKSFRGQYLEMSSDSAFEAWLASLMDSMIGFEMDEYNAQRPLAFTNWPTTDPLEHITEATRTEETALRQKRGEKPDTSVDLSTSDGFDHDAIGIDATLIRATKAYPAGTFAAFHAYPNFPDFMNIDPKYQKTLGPNGPSSYSGYLQDLKKHHGEMPVLISEVGVASSRGARQKPQRGSDMAGHSETDQALQNLKLYDEVLESGMAGAVMFSWLDEWFKRNRLYSDFELPYERNRLWHSVMDTNQNYGILAAEPKNQPRLETNRSRWQNVPTLNDGILNIKALADAEYLHLLIETPLQTDDKLEFALDTHPMGGANLIWTGQNKAEFLGTLEAGRGRLQTLPSYRPFKPLASGLLAHNRQAKPEHENAFVSIQTELNRRRIGRDGVQHPESRFDVGVLNPGTDPSGGRNPMIDYRWDSNGVQIRIPWTLIMVSDPSSRSVFDGSTETGSRQIADIGLNVRVGNLNASPMRFSWKTWEDQVPFELRLKPAYAALQKRWAGVK